MKSLTQFINESILKANHRIYENDGDETDNDPCFKFLEELRLKECEKLNIDPEDYDAQIIDHNADKMLAICNSVQTFPFAYFGWADASQIQKPSNKIIKEKTGRKSSENVSYILNVLRGQTHSVVIVFNKSKQTMLCFNNNLIEVINKNDAYYADYTKFAKGSVPGSLEFCKGKPGEFKLPNSSETVDASDIVTYGDLVKLIFDISEPKVKQLSGILDHKDTKIYMLYRD